MVEQTATPDLSHLTLDMFRDTMREWLALAEEATRLSDGYAPGVQATIKAADRSWGSLAIPMSAMHPDYLVTARLVCGATVKVVDGLLAGSVSLPLRTLVRRSETRDGATVERDQEVEELRREIEELRRLVVRHEAVCPIARRSAEALPPQL